MPDGCSAKRMSGDLGSLARHLLSAETISTIITGAMMAVVAIMTPCEVVGKPAEELMDETPEN